MACLRDLYGTHVLADGQRPTSLLLSRRIPVFVKIDRESQLLYRRYSRVLSREEPVPRDTSDPRLGRLPRNLERGSRRLVKRHGLPSRAPKFRGPFSTLPRKLARVHARKLPAANLRRHAVGGVTCRVDFTLDFKGFDQDALFLRVDDRVLSEIDLSGECKLSEFKDGGYAHPRPFDVIGFTRGGYQQKRTSDYLVSALEEIAFDRAFILDRKGFKKAIDERPMLERPDPEEFRIVLPIREDDLYILMNDFKALRQQASQTKELIKYPYGHRERMPGLYWMFQAAYAHNHLKIVDKEGVEDWLTKNAPVNTYRHRSLRTAKKFVWLNLDRRRGGGAERGEFAPDGAGTLETLEGYEWEFTSKWMSFILAIADWWLEIIKYDPQQSNRTLAEKLEGNKFAGLEVEDLVYLISGSPPSAKGEM